MVINNPKGEDEYLKSEEGATQGDVTAMQKYGIGIKPLIDILGTNINPKKCRQVWYADDSDAAGELEELRNWWDELCNTGPKLGYFPNNSKTVLILKDKSSLPKAQEIFGTTGVKITINGERHLGAVVGTQEYRDTYVKQKVEKWISDIEQLAEIAHDEPQVAYAAYTKGMCHRWGFLQRTVKDISHLFAPLENAIKNKLIPAIIGRSISPLERKIMELPVRFGGLGINDPQKTANQEYSNSVFVTKKLTEQIYNQDQSASIDMELIKHRKRLIEEMKENEYEKQYANIVKDPNTPSNLKKLLEMAREKGSGAWLTTLPIQSLGYALNKEDFRGSLSIRYGWRIKNMPLHCACGNVNNIDHSLSCKTGGYIIFRHNRVRDTVAEILKEICKDVRTEPELIPIESDFNRQTSDNKADKARLDVSCVGLWSPLEKTFLDIRVFHPCAPSYKDKPLKASFQIHEKQKKRAYNSRVINVEKSTFTPMVFTTLGAMSPECKTLIRRSATLIAEKRKEKYADVMGYISTKLRMSLLKSILLSVRGSRGTSRGTGKPISSVAFNLIPRSPEEDTF